MYETGARLTLTEADLQHEQARYRRGLEEFRRRAAEIGWMSHGRGPNA
ncbi:hypothetical protein ACSNOI_45225 [Actinomadura kijaniata]